MLYRLEGRGEGKINFRKCKGEEREREQSDKRKTKWLRTKTCKRRKKNERK
jgi:hypothetical protein